MKNEEKKSWLKQQTEQMVYFLSKNKSVIIPLGIGLTIGFFTGQALGLKTAISQYSKNISLSANSIY